MGVGRCFVLKYRRGVHIRVQKVDKKVDKRWMQLIPVLPILSHFLKNGCFSGSPKLYKNKGVKLMGDRGLEPPTSAV